MLHVECEMFCSGWVNHVWDVLSESRINVRPIYCRIVHCRTLNLEKLMADGSQRRTIDDDGAASHRKSYHKTID
jgi:hypothetical protein